MSIAIVSPIKVRVGNVAGLRGVLAYIKADKKTMEGELVFGKDCIPQKAFEQMLITKKAFNKMSGRQYAHFVQSFHRNDDLIPQKAMEIGKEFLQSNPHFANFQVCAAVHTNGPQLHIHYVINTVSFTNGTKWQSTPQDLKDMRALSDEICRKYNLHVLDKTNRGNKSYYESKNKDSWKHKLSQDVANCIFASSNKADFMCLMDELGVGCDFGRKNIMFTIRPGTYGLDKERKCSNFKLMPYGDFSHDNIICHMDYKAFLLEEAWTDFSLVSNVLDFFGRLNCPDNPREYENIFLENLDRRVFQGKTRQQIEEMLAREKHEQTAKMLSKAIRDRIEAEKAQNAMMWTALFGLIEEFKTWQKDKTQNQAVERKKHFSCASEDLECDEDEFELY